MLQRIDILGVWLFAVLLIFQIGCKGSSPTDSSQSKPAANADSAKKDGKSSNQLTVEPLPPLSNDQKAVLAFQVDVKRFVDSPLSEQFPLEDLFQQAAGADALNSKTLQELKTIRVFLSSPPNLAAIESMEQSPVGSDLPFEFCVTAEFVSEEAALELVTDVRTEGKPRNLNGLTVYATEFAPYAVRVIDEKTLRIGTDAYLAHDEADLPHDSLSENWKQLDARTLMLAADFGKARVLMTELANEARGQVPPMAVNFVDVLDQTEALSIAMDATSDELLNFKLDATDEESAKSINSVLATGLMALNFYSATQIAELRKDSDEAADMAKTLIGSMKPKVNGKRIEMVVMKPDGFESAMAEVARIQAESVKIVERQNRLKQLALAILSFYESRDALPWSTANPTFSNELSWRVQLLRDLEESALYERFDTTKGWEESPNRELLEAIPDIFLAKEGMTDILLVRPEPTPERLPSITDGLSNTIMLIESRTTVPWTSPQDIAPNQVVEMVKGLPENKVLLFARYDGSVGSLTNSMDEEQIMAMLIPNDGR